MRYRAEEGGMTLNFATRDCALIFRNVGRASSDLSASTETRLVFPLRACSPLNKRIPQKSDRYKIYRGRSWNSAHTACISSHRHKVFKSIPFAFCGSPKFKLIPSSAAPRVRVAAAFRRKRLKRRHEFIIRQQPIEGAQTCSRYYLLCDVCVFTL